MARPTIPAMPEQVASYSNEKTQKHVIVTWVITDIETGAVLFHDTAVTFINSARCT